MRRSTFWTFGLTLVAVVSIVGTAGASTITVGNINSGELNTFPFGGTYAGDSATRYQQVYTATDFSGIEDISAVTFWGGQNVGTNANGTYTLSISTTSKAVGSLDTNFVNNLGADNTTFFSGALPAYPGLLAPMTFTFATPFAYNSALGNLLIDVQFTGVTNDSFAFYVAQNGDFDGSSERMINGNTSETVGWGLVTSFNASAATVPEPTTLLLVGVGLVGALKRSRRRSDANNI